MRSEEWSQAAIAYAGMILDVMGVKNIPYPRLETEGEEASSTTFDSDERVIPTSQILPNR